MDMNLVRIFATVYQHQSYTRAAEVLGVTQPAISRAIRRLEQELGSSLFVKKGRNIAPTRRANQLSGEFQRALEIVDNAVSTKSELSSYCIESVLHRVGDMDEVAFKLPPLEQEVLFSHLRAQKVDLVIDVVTVKENSFVVEQIAQERAMVICRQDHPRIQGSISQEQFYQEGHVTYRGRRDGRDYLDMLAAEPIEPRDARIEVSHQSAMAMMVAQTDYVGLLTESFARLWADRLNLQVLESPIKIEPLPIHMLYHRRSLNDPFHRSAREKVKQRLKASITGPMHN